MDNGASSYRRFLEGDDRGLAEIVEQYKDGLILYLNGYVNNVFVAEELTEDTFFRLIVKRPRFSGRSSFKSWLYAIGRNVAVDRVRRDSRLIGAPAEELENLMAEEELERSYIKEESRIAVHRALAELSVEYRAVLWLTFFEGLSNKEAAAVLRKNQRQVRNLLYRAKQALKAKLEGEGFIYEDQ